MVEESPKTLFCPRLALPSPLLSPERAVVLRLPDFLGGFKIPSNRRILAVLSKRMGKPGGFQDWFPLSQNREDVKVVRLWLTRVADGAIHTIYSLFAFGGLHTLHTSTLTGNIARVNDEGSCCCPVPLTPEFSRHFSFPYTHPSCSTKSTSVVIKLPTRPTRPTRQFPFFSCDSWVCEGKPAYVPTKNLSQVPSRVLW